MVGFLLINKPVDWSSHDVVGYIRNFIIQNHITDEKRPKVGHAGTLDPFATGLLIVGIGRKATKRIDEFKNIPKEYIATIQLGATSDTYDRTGKISPKNTTSNIKTISKKQIQDTLNTFIGIQQQIPPMYSAKKVGGKKLYELARKGIEIERKPNEINIYSIKLLNIISDKLDEFVNINALKIKISCSTGTYIRTLAHDIGQRLGVGAYCNELMRTKIGKYKVEDAIAPEKLCYKDLNSLVALVGLNNVLYT